MPMYVHPAKTKTCVLCNRWTGSANLQFKSPSVGLEYDGQVNAKCAATNSTVKSQSTQANHCKHFDFNEKARSLL
jgi:hypothetical protein